MGAELSSEVKLTNLSVEAIAEFAGKFAILAEYQKLILDHNVDGESLDRMFKKFISENNGSSTLSSKLRNEVTRTRLQDGEGDPFSSQSGNPAVAAAVCEVSVEKSVSVAASVGKMSSDAFFLFGGDEDYKDGLTKKIHTLTRSMRDECCSNDAGKWRSEFDYVVVEAAVETRESEVRVPARYTLTQLP